MANISLKLLACFLQIRSLQTKASKLGTPSLTKPKGSTKTKVETKLIKKKAQTQAQAQAPLSFLPVGKREQAIITFLKREHFSDTQIDELIGKYPRILKSRVSTNIDPKLKFLKENGFKGNLLPELIMSNPFILRRSLTAHLIPSVQVLKTQLGMDNEKTFQKVIRRASWLLTSDLKKFLLPNIHLLEKGGVPMSGILKLFSSQPRSLLCSGDRVVYGIEMAKKFGIKPDDATFIHAFRVFVSMSQSNWNKKVEVFKSLGWSNEDIVSTMVRQPLCLTCSEEKLRTTMEYLLQTAKLEPKTIIAFPKLVMYSFQKRIVPRFNVVMVLQEKKLLEKIMPYSLVNMSEKDFIRKYITKYINQVPHLLDVYLGNLKIHAAAVQQ